MFTSISWQQYLLSISALTITYYGSVILLYYKSELADFFDRKRYSSENGNPGLSKRTVLGEAKPDLNVSSISNEELLFSSEEETN